MSGSMKTKPRDIAELVQAQSRLFADLEILTCVNIAPDGSLVDEKRTYEQLYDNACRLAAGLCQAGIARGDRFVLMLHNHPEFVEAMLAAALLGATFVPVDPRSMGDKLAYMLNFVECKLVIAGDYALPAIFDASDSLTHTRSVIVVGEWADAKVPANLACTGYDDALSAGSTEFSRVAPNPDGVMFMMFTSGTTGNPKAVVRRHGHHMKGIKGLRALGVRQDDTLFTGLPLSHINAQSTLGTGLALAIPVVMSRKFTKSRLWDICRAYDCTVFTLLGGMIPEIFSVPEAPGDADNPVRLVIASGMPAALWNEYKRRFGIEITEVYGSTEAGGVLINLLGEGPVGSMGKPPKGSLATIMDPSGAACPPGVAGELCFRPETGDVARITYFRNEDASREKTQTGWFRTGDIAHRDENGWFYFHHRAGGGVRRNGDFVNTSLVETILAKSPLVEDVFVYGVETNTNIAGEKTLVAAIVFSADDRVDELRTWCASHLQKNEIPEIWQPLKVIPKTISEKPVERDCIALLKKNGLVELA